MSRRVTHQNPLERGSINHSGGGPSITEAQRIAASMQQEHIDRASAKAEKLRKRNEELRPRRFSWEKKD
jgi:hypothetical protein